jgi:hypothetical protein
MPDDPRGRRVGENESLFRQVNERVEELAGNLDLPTQFVCECGRAGCDARLSVPLDEYERVRAHGRRFILAAGHERSEVEKVIDERDGWLVVEKTGEAGEAAEQEDPRQADG